MLTVGLLTSLIAAGCTAAPRSVDERVADAVLESTVRERLGSEPRLSTTNIDVAVSDGVITLTGRAPSERLRRRAEALARDVEGARDVRNLIRVHGPGK